MTERPSRAQILHTGLLVAAVALTLATGCRASSAGDTVLRFWAMGREGEVVTQLLPEFERAHPGIRVRVQQLPWSAAHEKLLTAFAGDATPDVCQLGNTWIPEFVALGALERLDRYTEASSVVQPSDYFSGIWDTNQVAGGLYGIPWYVDTRLLFYRRDILEQAGFSAPPVSWPEWTAALAAIKARWSSDRYGILLPLNDVDPLLALALQQDDPLLRDDGRWGNFQSAGFRTALAFYLEMFRQGWAPPLADREVSNVWSEFGRGYFAFYISGPWNIGELKRRLPPGEQATWATAPLPGTDRAGRLHRGGLEPGDLPRLAPQGGGVAARGVSLPAGHPAEVPRADRRSAAAARDVERSRAGRRRPRSRLPRTARAGQAAAEGARVGAHRQRGAPGAERAVHGQLLGGPGRQRARRAAPIGSSKSGAGCSRRGRAG